MSNDFINNIDFNKEVRLKKPKREKAGEKKRPFGFYKKICRIIYFLIMMTVFFFGGRYTIECFVSFCQGTEHQSWDEISESYKEFKRDGY